MPNDQKLKVEILDGTPAGCKHREAGDIVEVPYQEGKILIAYKKARLVTDEESEDELRDVHVTHEEQKTEGTDGSEQDPFVDHGDGTAADPVEQDKVTQTPKGKKTGKKGK